MRARIYHIQSILQIINNIDETIHYTPQLSMGIVDIHALLDITMSYTKCNVL